MPAARCALLLNKTSPPPSTPSDSNSKWCISVKRSDAFSEAERTGVKSVPALVLDNHAYHINFGASLDTLK